MAYPHEPATLNPFLPGGESPATRDLVRLLMPTLYRIGPDGARTRSLLAEDPVTAESGGQFHAGIRLRSDAKWSDGRPITTADVRFTWQLLRDRRYPVVQRFAYDRITDVRIEDAHSATLVFAKPYPAWRDLFSAGAGILPEHALRNARFDQALRGGWPVSGGPYVLTSWTRGLELVFDRTPNAWGDEPYLDRIRVQIVPDVVSAVSLLRAGKVDVLGPYAAVDLERRGKLIPGSSVTSDFGSTWACLLLNGRATVLSDVRVRRALRDTLDRAAITEGLVRAEGRRLDQLSAGSEVGEFGAFGAPDVPGAIRTLTAAGWRGGGVRAKSGRELTFTLASSPSELMDRVVRAMYTQARRAGFDLNAVTLDDDRLWRDWLRGSRFEAALVVLRDAPGRSLFERFRSDSPGNTPRISNPALNAALDASVDVEAAGATAERALAGAVPAIPLFRLRVTIVAGAGLANVRANGSADGFLWNAGDWTKR